MAKNQRWHDDYWLFVLQLYMRQPVGVKPLYSRALVDLSMELHIPPQEIYARQCAVAALDTPRIERIWAEYGKNPRRLSRAVRMLRAMRGFNSAGDFYDGVEVEETFESDFRPLAEDERMTPVMLTLILDLYFQLTPNTMVVETPEVQELARLIHLPARDIVSVMQVYQHCDPYLRRRDAIASPLLEPCKSVWRRYGNSDPQQLASYAAQLKEYYQ
ncbi:MAG: hypothetical protein ILA25_03040 [Prevotella sp.]|nr:hypothetical protein [Prevotella sp.]